MNMGKLNAFISISPPTEDEAKILKIQFGILGVIILITTILHHGFPSVLNVPLTPGPFEGFGNYSLFIIIFYDISAIIMGTLALYHAIRTMGWFKGSQFFIGSFVFSGLEENEWILSGRFGPNPSYYFTNGGLWFFEIPVYTCIGWFVVSYCLFTIIRTLIPGGSKILVSILAGFFAMSIDLWLDPILVNIGLINDPTTAGLWVWENMENPKLFTIPVMNFVGWWLVVTCFTFHFQWVFDYAKKYNLSPRKTLQLFYILFPFYWIMIYIFLHGVEWIIDPWWGGADKDLFPIRFEEVD
jgi:uncharacterized membrane protein